MSTQAQQQPRYEAHESPPLLASLGYGAQFSLIASATLLVTPVVVAKASGRDDSYLVWVVFASLLVAGLTTMMQVRSVGVVGARAMLPMFTAAFSIPFCIDAVSDGGPATLAALVIVCGIGQIAIAKWLFILRRIVTPVVGGTVLMILSITLASVVPRLLPEASDSDALGAHVAALATLGIVSALILRGSAVVRLWGPIIGIVAGSAVAAAFGLYDSGQVREAAWVGLPGEWPGLDWPPVVSGLGVTFWTLLPAFLFLSVIISIQVNGESIAQQRVSRRDARAVDFREVQAALAGTGVTNLFAGIGGTMPYIVNPGAVSYTQTTGVASLRVGYLIGGMLIALAFLPKVSGLLSSIPGSVMAGYLIVLSAYLFVDGARTVIQSEPNRQRITVAGVCFWIGAAFQFGLFSFPEIVPVWGALLQSGITTGGVAAIVMILYLEFTNPRGMRFHSRLHIDALPELNDFLEKFAGRRGWDTAMRERLSAVAEETLLTLAPLDFGELAAQDDESAEEEDPKPERQLVVLASSDGPVATLEFIGGAGDEGNMEDRLRQLQQFDSDNVVEQDLSLQLLRAYASSVRHQQFHNTDIITVRIAP
ncbi:MAG: purine/pyrimidine permease [Chloroflexota bacterium]|nr:purine/pyrimidine permease [Chloroflexota bacterium]MDE2942255.1 purine/pyrimidine permease [Chloroflexota bacterium]MDE3267743.1 purine/pyrimidine permease [Chloroflexota bacterium]